MYLYLDNQAKKVQISALIGMPGQFIHCFKSFLFLFLAFLFENLGEYGRNYFLVRDAWTVQEMFVCLV